MAAVAVAWGCGGESTTAPEAPAVLAARDRAALVALYNATNGPSWTEAGNWLTDAPTGEWYGVATDADGRVVRLDLYKNGLKGPIPPELGNLTSLEWLQLLGNALTGPIPPELGKLDRLQTLELGGNRLTGPIPGRSPTWPASST